MFSGSHGILQKIRTVNISDKNTSDIKIFGRMKCPTTFKSEILGFYSESGRRVPPMLSIFKIESYLH